MPIRITSKLVAAFAALIFMIVTVGVVGLNRLAEINGSVQEIMDQRWAKVQLSREALSSSGLNSRLTMQIFLAQDENEIAPLLVQRVELSARISALLTNLDSNVDCDAERVLLADIRAARV